MRHWHRRLDMLNDKDKEEGEKTEQGVDGTPAAACYLLSLLYAATNGAALVATKLKTFGDRNDFCSHGYHGIVGKQNERSWL